MLIIACNWATLFCKMNTNLMHPSSFQNQPNLRKINFLLNIIDKSPVGSRKICVLDAERQNTTLLGSLKQLQDTFAMDAIPKTKEQMTAAIEKIVASFSDIDEAIEEYDSVADAFDEFLSEEE